MRFRGAKIPSLRGNGSAVLGQIDGHKTRHRPEPPGHSNAIREFVLRSSANPSHVGRIFHELGKWFRSRLQGVAPVAPSPQPVPRAFDLVVPRFVHPHNCQESVRIVGWKSFSAVQDLPIEMSFFPSAQRVEQREDVRWFKDVEVDVDLLTARDRFVQDADGLEFSRGDVSPRNGRSKPTPVYIVHKIVDVGGIGGCRRLFIVGEGQSSAPVRRRGDRRRVRSRCECRPANRVRQLRRCALRVRLFGQ